MGARNERGLSHKNAPLASAGAEKVRRVTKNAFRV